VYMRIRYCRWDTSEGQWVMHDFWCSKPEEAALGLAQTFERHLVHPLGYVIERCETPVFAKIR